MTSKLLLSAMMAATLAGQLIGQTQPAPDTQPPMEFSLELDGRTIDVVAGRSFEVEVAGKKLKGKIAPKPDRAFTAGPVSFRYPSDFAFECDRDEPTITIWTLDGNNTVVMLSQYTVALEEQVMLAAAVKAGIEQFGKENVKTEPVSIELADRKLAGKRLLVNVAGKMVHQDYYAIRAGDAAFVLMVQDSPTDDGKTSAETLRTLDLLRKTFRIMPP